MRIVSSKKKINIAYTEINKCVNLILITVVFIYE